MEEEYKSKESDHEVGEVIDTKHEPHEHARPRILIGLGAIVLLLLVGLVWSRWGDAIKEKCVGEEVCTVDVSLDTDSE